MKLIRMSRLALAVVLAAGSAASHAVRTAFELRDFYMEGTSGSGFFSGEDTFANGNPLTGLTYSRQGLPDSPGSWNSPSVFRPGAERTGAAPDFAGTQYGIGGLLFRHGDANNTTSNLTPAGHTSQSVSLGLQAIFNPPAGLALRSGRFEVDSFWNFAVPQPGESVVLGLSGSSGPDYTDRLLLRFGSDIVTGQTSFSFLQESRTGSTLARTVLGAVSLQQVLADPSGVDYLGFTLERDLPTTGTPNPGVRATVALLDAVVDPATGDPKILAIHTFSAPGAMFESGGQASGVFAAASWLTPVPEPGTAVLMAFGLGAAGAFARRRRPG